LAEIIKCIAFPDNSQITDGLNEIGKDLDSVTLDDLHPADEFHIRGDITAKRLIKLSSSTPGIQILDDGSGMAVWHVFFRIKQVVVEPVLI